MDTAPEAVTEPVDEDLVWGGQNIAKAINRKPRATFHMLERNELPARKVGGRWVASRRRLREHLAGASA